MHYEESNAGAVIVYKVGDDGSLTSIGEASSCGKGPCHISLDARYIIRRVPVLQATILCCYPHTCTAVGRSSW